MENPRENIDRAEKGRVAVMSDRELLDAACGGDVSAENEWIHRYLPVLFRYIRLKFNDHHRTSDMAEKIMSEYLQSLAANIYTPENPLVIFELADSRVNQMEHQGTGLGLSDKQTALLEVMGKLPLEQRIVFEMSVLAGLKDKEIKLRMGINPDDIHRIRESVSRMVVGIPMKERVDDGREIHRKIGSKPKTDRYAKSRERETRRSPARFPNRPPAQSAGRPVERRWEERPRRPDRRTSERQWEAKPRRQDGRYPARRPARKWEERPAGSDAGAPERRWKERSVRGSERAPDTRPDIRREKKPFRSDRQWEEEFVQQSPEDRPRRSKDPSRDSRNRSARKATDTKTRKTGSQGKTSDHESRPVRPRAPRPSRRDDRD